MAKRKRRKRSAGPFGLDIRPVLAVRRHPATSLFLIFGGMAAGVLASRIAPAPGRTEGLSALRPAAFWCPYKRRWTFFADVPGAMGGRPSCSSCIDKGECPIYLKRILG
jgi:hypothetical protein